MGDILQFKFLNSSFTSQFWFSLYKLKLEDWKLDVSSTGITAKVTTKLEFDENSFSNQTESVHGVLINTNTIEEFKEFDKQKFQQQVVSDILNVILSGEFINDLSLLTKFGLLTFADLKKYRFFYWVLIPALIPLEAYRFQSKKLELTPDQILKLREIREYSIVHVTKDSVTQDTFQNYERYDFKTCFILVKDVDWTFRNFLYALKVKLRVDTIRVLRLEFLQEYLEIELLGGITDLPQSVGWERNNNMKMGPKMVDLSGFMDPVKLADSAVDLNLKLIKWRAMPNIPLDKISNIKCCLFGAGTLGCYTARALMAWGVRNITFVDSGKVSFSNPVRQPLFRFKDCLDGGAFKAIAAAEELNAIFPGMNAKGHGEH